MRFLPLLLSLAGCPGPGEATCVATTSDGVGTVLLVDVTVPAAASVHVEFGDEAFDRATPAVDVGAGAAHTFELLGLGPLADVTWRVIADGEEVCAGNDSTRNLPSDLPEFTVDVYDEARASSEPYVLLATTGGAPGLVMVDRRGEIVWYRVPPGESAVQWVQPYWYGGHALYNSFDAEHLEDQAMIHRVDSEGQSVEDVRTIEGHHTFTLLPDGTYSYLRRDRRMWYDPIRQEETPVIGDAVVERAPDGTERVLFDSWDWLPVRVTPAFYMPFYRDGKDWTHANAVNYSAERDSYLTSFSNLDTIVEIDRTTGIPRRWLGIDGEDPYGYSEGSRRMGQPHDPRWTGPDTISVFITDDSVGRSGVVEYRVDEENHVLDQVWEFGFAADEPAHRAFFLGQAFRLENGNTLVKWAQTARMVEATPEGDIVWDIGMGVGAIFQESDLVVDLYRDAP